MRFYTRDREAGNKIEEFATLEEAREAIKAYEAADKQDDSYTEDFYEIYDTEKKGEDDSNGNVHERN